MTQSSDREAAERYGKHAIEGACHSNPTNPFSDYEVRLWAMNGFEAGIAHARREMEGEIGELKAALQEIAAQPDAHPLASWSHHLARHALKKYGSKE